MNKLSLAFVGFLALAMPAMAQTALPAGHPPIGPGAPTTTGPIVGGQNNTGSDVDVVVPRGSTGASTYQSDSAAAGNSNQPERAVPQGSGGGGGNSN